MKWYWIQLMFWTALISTVPGYLVWWWMNHG